MSETYRLVGRVVIPVSMDEYMARLKQNLNPRKGQVGNTIVGARRVSTVFLGTDHSWTPREPMLFETLAGDEIRRYPDWKTARACHNAIVRHLAEGKPGLPDFLYMVR